MFSAKTVKVQIQLLQAEEEREGYRQRARSQAERKLKEWQEKMKMFPNQALNPIAQVTSQVHLDNPIHEPYTC
jgi:hypothetical protein